MENPPKGKDLETYTEKGLYATASENHIVRGKRKHGHKGIRKIRLEVFKYHHNVYSIINNILFNVTVLSNIIWIIYFIERSYENPSLH